MSLDYLFNLIEKSNKIVFFGGAGVSTASGIPDFRSVDGLYSQKYDYPPEMILSDTFFYNNTKEFYKFYYDKIINVNAKPNYTHQALAYLEKVGKLSGVVTQNIDGLHQMAGSKKVLELHGSIYRNYSINTNQFFDLDYIISKEDEGIPMTKDGELIKPDVVLYGEPLNNDILRESVKIIGEADLLIIGGTSLTVYPASGLVDYYRGKEIVVINKTEILNPTFYQINDDINKVFRKYLEYKGVI